MKTVDQNKCNAFDSLKNTFLNFATLRLTLTKMRLKIKVIHLPVERKEHETLRLNLKLLPVPSVCLDSLCLGCEQQKFDLAVLTYCD